MDVNNFMKTDDWKETESIFDEDDNNWHTITWEKQYDNGITGTIDEYLLWDDMVDDNFTSHYRIKVERIIEITTATFQLSTEQKKSGVITTTEVKDLLNNSVQKTNQIYIHFEDSMPKEIDGIDQLEEAKSTCNLMAMAIQTLILGDEDLGDEDNAQP